MLNISKIKMPRSKKEFEEFMSDPKNVAAVAGVTAYLGYGAQLAKCIGDEIGGLWWPGWIFVMAFWPLIILWLKWQNRSH